MSVYDYAGKLAKELHINTLNKMQKSVDMFIERFTDKANPIILDGNVIYHSDSERYINGNFVADFIEFDNASEEDKQKFNELFELQSTYNKESMQIIRYIKSTCAKIALETLDETVRAFSLLLQILPPILSSDRALLEKCNVPESALDNILAENNLYKPLFEDANVSAEEFINIYRDVALNELIEKYYALDLLTNF